MSNLGLQGWRNRDGQVFSAKKGFYIDEPKSKPSDTEKWVIDSVLPVLFPLKQITAMRHYYKDSVVVALGFTLDNGYLDWCVSLVNPRVSYKNDYSTDKWHDDETLCATYNALLQSKRKQNTTKEAPVPTMITKVDQIQPAKDMNIIARIKRTHAESNKRAAVKSAVLGARQLMLIPLQDKPGVYAQTKEFLETKTGELLIESFLGVFLPMTKQLPGLEQLSYEIDTVADEMLTQVQYEGKMEVVSALGELIVPIVQQSVSFIKKPADLTEGVKLATEDVAK